jgi:hypothetical protein
MKCKWENQAVKNVASLEEEAEEILLIAVLYCTK